MAKAIGIDIGTRACKVAVVDGGPKGARLVRFAEAEYAVGVGGAPTAADVIAGVKKALADARGPRGAASFAMPAEQLIVREISVPFVQEEQIRKVVKFEFEPHLHAGAIEDIVLDFVITGPANLGPGKTGSRILVLAAVKGAIRDRLEQLKAASVDPLHIDVDVAALFNLAQQCGALDMHPNCLLIDIGARTTKALAIRDGKLRVARSIRIGTRGAERDLSNRFQGDDDAAKRALASAASPFDAAASSPEGPSTVEIVTSVAEIEAAVARAVSDDFLGRVLRETSRTLPTSGESAPITCVFLTGGGAKHRHARDRIATHFGVAVLDLPVLANLSHALAPSEQAAVASVGAVALGTALKVIGIDGARIDLRQEEFRFSRTFDRVKVAAATCVTLLFFCVFLYFLGAWVKMDGAKRELKALRIETSAQLGEELFAKYEQKMPEAPKAPTPATDDNTAVRQSKDHLETVRVYLQSELGLATQVPPIRSCIEPWTVVSKVLAEFRAKTPYLLVKTEKYVQGQGDITLIVNEPPEAEVVKNRLSELKEIVKSAETRPPKRNKDGTKSEVTIHIEFVEKTSDESESESEAEESK